MADYWKSNARRMCDVCKVWMADNKTSISIHEGGKKHKENVQRRIKEARKRGVEEIHGKEEIQRQLAAMEKAALEAYKKDVQSDPLLAGAGGIPARQFTGSRLAGAIAGVARQSSDVHQAENTDDVESEAAEDDGDPAVNSVWCAYSTEEGYVYYYNNTSGETTWEKPAGFTSKAPPVVLPSEDAGEAEKTETSKASNASSSSTSADTAAVVDASSAEASVREEEYSTDGEEKEAKVSGWSRGAAIATSHESPASESTSSQSESSRSDQSTSVEKKEADSGGFVKKNPRSGRDAAFGGWSTVSVSTTTSARLAGVSGSSSSTPRVKTEGGMKTKRPDDVLDDDGLGVGLTCRDEEEAGDRFKFKEKVLSSGMDGSNNDDVSCTTSTTGMFKKRKRAGGRRERTDGD